MPTRSNEQLCRLAQKGDTVARDILLEYNLGFIRKIALEQYRSMGLDENDIGIDLGTASILVYRYGFTDGIEHPLIGAALHFHLSESRTKKVEGEAMDSLRGKLPWWF